MLCLKPIQIAFECGVTSNHCFISCLKWHYLYFILPSFLLLESWNWPCILALKIQNFSNGLHLQTFTELLHLTFHPSLIENPQVCHWALAIIFTFRLLCASLFSHQKYWISSFLITRLPKSFPQSSYRWQKVIFHPN